MPVLRCLICKSKEKKRLYELNKRNGPNDTCSIRSYIIEFLGPCEELLQDDDRICDLCVYLLDKLLYIKKCVYSFIAYNRGNYPFQFAPVYKNFLENLQKLSYEDRPTGLQQRYTRPHENANEAEHNENHEYPDETPYVGRREEYEADFLRTQHDVLTENANEVRQNINYDRSSNVNRRQYETGLLQTSRIRPSENSDEAERNAYYGEFGDALCTNSEINHSDDECETELLELAHTSPYNEVNEAEFANRGYPNRRRRGRSRGRRRRRGHNWTRRKSSRSKSRLSTHTEPFSRSNREHLTPISLYTYIHSDRSEYDDNDEEVASTLAYSDRYEYEIYQNRRTRSIISLPDDEKMYKYKCLDDCPVEFRNLTELTDHKIKEHNMLAKFLCYECYDTKFVSRDDLKRHNEIYHHILISNCPLCSVELRSVEELQKHMAQHKLHSYPCLYCDRSFLNKSSRNKHNREYHTGRKKRIKRLAHVSLNCVYKSDKSQLTVLPHNKYEGRILWRLQRTRVRRLRDFCIDAISRYHEGSVDTLQLMEITYGEKNVNVINNQEGSDAANEVCLDADSEASHDGSSNAVHVIQDIEIEETVVTPNSTSLKHKLTYPSEEIAVNPDDDTVNNVVGNIANGPEKTFAYDHFENFVNRTGSRFLDGTASKSALTAKKSNNKSKYLENMESKQKELNSNGPVNISLSISNDVEKS